MNPQLCTKPAEVDEPLDSPRGSLAAMDVQPAAVPSINFDGMPVRVRQIAVLRGLGYSLREIGDHFGVSPQAISLMLSRHQRRSAELSGTLEFAQLSPRAVSVLARLGIRSRVEARQSCVIKLLKGQRNCGPKTLQEVGRWMNENGWEEGNE
ncbi:MAG: hypothetical protein ACKOEI_12845 [Chthoniobacterales bacterium]